MLKDVKALGGIGSEENKMLLESCYIGRGEGRKVGYGSETKLHTIDDVYLLPILIILRWR